jgi:hypothetical protein
MFDTMEPGFVWKTTAVRSEFSLDEPKFEWVVQCIPGPSSLTLAGIGILGVLIYGSRYRSR